MSVKHALQLKESKLIYFRSKECHSWQSLSETMMRSHNDILVYVVSTKR